MTASYERLLSLAMGHRDAIAKRSIMLAELTDTVPIMRTVLGLAQAVLIMDRTIAEAVRMHEGSASDFDIERHLMAGVHEAGRSMVENMDDLADAAAKLSPDLARRIEITAATVARSSKSGTI